jgi:hypothetical protein
MRDRDLVGGAGVPVDPDPRLVLIGFSEQGDIGDHVAQQPFTVLMAGGGRVPEPGQVAGEFLQLRSPRGNGGSVCRADFRACSASATAVSMVPGCTSCLPDFGNNPRLIPVNTRSFLGEQR